MSIVRWSPKGDPAQIPPDQVILVDSDAPSNAAAILEIARWCHENNLERAAEASLSTVFFEGRLLRRGRGYRLSDSDRDRMKQEGRKRVERAARRLSRMKPTQSSVELTRE